MRERIIEALCGFGCRVSSSVFESACRQAVRQDPELVVIASGERNVDAALELLREMHTSVPHAKYLFMAGVSNEDLAIAALHAGASRYLRQPWTTGDLCSAVRMLLPADSADTPIERLSGGERLIGRTPVMRQLRMRLARVAPTSSTVLILGETGTGKELVAELLHANGPRSARPFICINSAAIPDSLLENELFGHERGAFTGATGAQSGKLAAAQGGTAFLDEIGDVGLPVQAKLLRAIENKSVFRLGATRSVPLDVRFVAATNCDLERSMSEGRFRPDLYYRLNVVRVELPSLRDRPEDIPLLVDHYLRQLNRELGRSVASLSRRTMDALCLHTWPGNVRELRNVLEAILVNLAPETTGVVDAPPEVMRQITAAGAAPVSERERLLRVLGETQWNKTKAATRLNMSRMTLYRRMQHHKVSMRRQG